MNLQVGDKVHYIPFEGADKSLIENGIVKEEDTYSQDAVRVVYHCNKDWENYKDYTSALTNLQDLEKGWIEK